jgi:N-acetylmuramoyl-L-alanine amidase
MSASPTRVLSEAPSPLLEGNRVLESIARREAVLGLVAFSSLHRQIRDRRRDAERDSEHDLFETERFILDEVLQLVCDRALEITRADGIVVALAEAVAAEPSAEGIFAEGRFAERISAAGRAAEKRSAMLCRASAGALAPGPGVRLIESEFLRDCVKSGRIVRCDDSELDVRVEGDFAQQLGARSTVLVPLRGRHQQLGVLQAFSITPWAFSDDDVRCFDLFAELVLSALRPEDQDRRIHWLADVAEEVLRAKPSASAAAAWADATIATPAPESAGLPFSDIAELAEPVAIPGAGFEAADADFAAQRIRDEQLAGGRHLAEEQSGEDLSSEDHSSEDHSSEDYSSEDHSSEDHSSEDHPREDHQREDHSTEVHADKYDNPEAALAEALPPMPFLQRLTSAGGSHPGLSVVLGLVVVAALFSAGGWWGMQEQAGRSVMRIVTGKTALPPPAVNIPPAPPANFSSPAVSNAESDQRSEKITDNLLEPETPAGGALSGAAENKIGSLPKVTGVRHWTSALGSTVVIDMEDQVPYEVHRLMSPERIYFDLHDTVLAPGLNGKTMDVGDTSLTRVRIAQVAAGVTRVVLDTKDGSNFSVSMESNPYRLVVELRGSGKGLAAKIPQSQFASNPAASTLLAANRLPAPVTAPAPIKAAPATALPNASDRLPPFKTAKFRIVLDAGHGGWDLGTVGRQGLLEKDLVLDVTQRLGKLLQARLGSEVMFTRTADTYLPLEQRADIANQAQADLFVSVHANYSSSAAARGVETYYTNLFSAPGSREVEKHDDGTFANPTPVSLSPGGLHEKIEESRRLAASVQRSLYATLAAKSPDIRNRGIKDSAFAVLTGTTMPSVLTEISFVSSPADEHNLQSDAYRQQIAEALYQGIARYQQSASVNGARAKVAQLQKPSAR